MVIHANPDEEPKAWYEPGVFPVAPGVHRIPLPLPHDSLRAVNSYVIEDDAGVTLIDAGDTASESREYLRAALAALDRDIHDVRQVLVTHVHSDHYGSAPALRRTSGAGIALGEHEQRSLELAADPEFSPLVPHLAALRRNGAYALADQVSRRLPWTDRDPRDWEQPDRWLLDSEFVDAGEATLRAMHTPGHTHGHIVLVAEDMASTFTGDHVLPHITPSIGFEAMPVSRPLADYLRSLHRVRALPDTQMLPAHGPVADSVHHRIDALLDHHGARLDVMSRLVLAGASNAYEVACATTWTRRERHLSGLDPFNQMLAVNETAAHLDLLADQGRLRAERDHRGTVHYG